VQCTDHAHTVSRPATRHDQHDQYVFMTATQSQISITGTDAAIQFYSLIMHAFILFQSLVLDHRFNSATDTIRHVRTKSYTAAVITQNLHSQFSAMSFKLCSRLSQPAPFTHLSNSSALSLGTFIRSTPIPSMLSANFLPGYCLRQISII